MALLIFTAHMMEDCTVQLLKYVGLLFLKHDFCVNFVCHFQNLNQGKTIEKWVMTHPIMSLHCPSFLHFLPRGLHHHHSLSMSIMHSQWDSSINLIVIVHCVNWQNITADGSIHSPNPLDPISTSYKNALIPLGIVQCTAFNMNVLILTLHYDGWVCVLNFMQSSLKCVLEHSIAEICPDRWGCWDSSF